MAAQPQRRVLITANTLDADLHTCVLSRCTRAALPELGFSGSSSSDIGSFFSRSSTVYASFTCRAKPRAQRQTAVLLTRVGHDCKSSVQRQEDNSRERTFAVISSRNCSSCFCAMTRVFPNQRRSGWMRLFGNSLD